MVSLAEDLMLALDRVAFAKRLGLKPDPGKRIYCAPHPREFSSIAADSRASPR